MHIICIVQTNINHRWEQQKQQNKKTKAYTEYHPCYPNHDRTNTSAKNCWHKELRDIKYEKIRQTNSDKILSEVHKQQRY